VFVIVVVRLVLYKYIYTMKLIFLDVDGVLCLIGRDEKTNKLKSFVSGEAVENLKRIVDETHARIVLSSSWRFFENSFHRLQTVRSSNRIESNRSESLMKETSIRY